MFAVKEKRAYGLQRDFHVLEREQRVTKILGSHAFRAELEGILQGQLEGSPKSRALRSLQDNVVPAAAVEAAHRQAGTGLTAGGSPVLPINDLRGVRSSRYALAERQLRCKLASLCRLVDWFGWSQLVQNHVSAQGMVEREEFLMNPYGLLYSEVTASSLVRVNNEGDILDPGSTQLGVNRAGLELHSAIYEARRDVKCIMHLHTVAGAAISAMTSGLLPISEEALAVGKVSYYNSSKRRSLAGQRERKEFSRTLGKNKALILRNHGLVAMGSCVEECFHVMYNLIQACQIQVAAISAGIANLMQVPLEEGRGQEEEVGGARVWTKRGQMEFEALMRMLDNKGYQTGYRYCGLSLLQSESSAASPTHGRAAWEEVVVGGKADMAARQRRRRGMKTAEEEDDKEGAWSFLDDNRSHDKPLTKNTKIGVGRLGAVSPVPEEAVGSKDPWDFLTSRDSSPHTESKPGIQADSAAHRDASASPQHLSNTSGTSLATTEDTATHSTSHRMAAGKRRVRRRKPSQSASSPRATSPATGSASHSRTPSAPAHTPATLSPPPNLTPLQLAQYTAEKVAQSTGMAVQKLALQRLKPAVPERTLSEPDLNCVSPRDRVHSMASKYASSHNIDSKNLDSQGYSSGDEASNAEASLPHSPSRLAQPSTDDRSSASPLDVRLSPYLQTTPKPPHHSSPTTQFEAPQLTPTNPPTLHTTPLHTPADIRLPGSYSSAEKAAHVARIVADSTGSAVQKLTNSLSERNTLSLPSGDQTSFPSGSLSSTLADN